MLLYIVEELYRLYHTRTLFSFPSQFMLSFMSPVLSVAAFGFMDFYPTSRTYIDVTKEEREGKVRDVCRNAIWSLSSCKPGHGIEQLLDESTDTFWQSDGPQPHCVSIQFPQKTTLTRLCLYTDYKADESYTPSRLAVMVGNTIHDLIQLANVVLQQPTGWCILPLTWPDGSPIRTFMLQIIIMANHQNGRDTHLRAIRLHSPIEHRGLEVLCPFESLESRMLMQIR